MTDSRQRFDALAAEWDQNPGRVRLAHAVADAMLREVAPTGREDVLDVGCGTGLVTLRLQPAVRSITGVDASPGMLAVLQAKVQAAGLANVRTLQVDPDRGESVPGTFDLVVSSMMLHHVRDTAPMLRAWFDLLRPGGALALADLDREDGSFHADPTGVHHLGFERADLAATLADAGFTDVRDGTATTLERPQEDGSVRRYPVFLIVARRPAEPGSAGT